MASILKSLEAALKSAKTKPEDAAGIQLAIEYARLIDQSLDRDTLDKLGPKLQNILTALGMTPAGRTTQATRGGAKDDPGDAGTANSPADQLAALRNRAAARKNGTAALDTPAS